MKLRLLLFNFLFFAFINAVLAAPPSCIQTKDGVIVFTDPAQRLDIDTYDRELLYDGKHIEVKL